MLYTENKMAAKMEIADSCIFIFNEALVLQVGVRDPFWYQRGVHQRDA